MGEGAALCLNPNSNPPLAPSPPRWVMSFERPNLHFSVQRKASGPAAPNFKPLLDAGGSGGLGGWWRLLAAAGGLGREGVAH